MGASIYWQPLKGKHLPVGARSRFISIMSEAFGSIYPWNISNGHINQLRAMSIGAEDEGIKSALNILVDAVMDHEQIIVWPEY